MKTLGGCGGTIVARALATTGALVLSEVNPRSAQLFSGALNPIVQVNRDHHDLLPDAWRGVDALTLGVPSVFGRFMADLRDNLDRPLLIRDYSYVDYIGAPFVWPRPKHPSLEAALQPFGRLNQALLVRHPVRAYASLIKHGPLASVLTPEIFVEGHLDFLDRNVDVPVFHYEVFIETPDQFLEQLCASLKLEYSPDWLDRLSSAPTLTGHPLALRAQAVTAPESSPQTELAARLSRVNGFDRLLHLTGHRLY